MIDCSTNTCLSSMNFKQKIEFLNCLKDYFIDYRDKLCIPSNINFGIEIEAIPNNIFWPKGYILSLFPELLDYDYAQYDDNPYGCWVVKRDDTLESENGFEITSPILSNKDAWGDIKSIVDKLNDYFYVDGICASQIHFDARSIIDYDSDKLLNILKFWALYEDIIFRFSYGQFNGPRKLIPGFASPIAGKIYKKFFKLKDLSYEGVLNNFIDFKYNSINLCNLTNSKQTIEVRVPNGTLDKVVWQNLINMFAHFFMHCVSDDFDNEKVTYNFRKFTYPYHSVYGAINSYSVLNINKALEFADIIFDNDLDKLNFLRQYFKDDVFTTTPICDICDDRLELVKKFTI